MTFYSFSLSMLFMFAFSSIVYGGSSSVVGSIKDDAKDDHLEVASFVRILQGEAANEVQGNNGNGSGNNIDAALTCATSVNKLPVADRLGTKRILIVRVTGVDAKGNEKKPRSSKAIHDDFFGSDGDKINMASQIKRCSFNRDAGSSILTVVSDNSMGKNGIVDIKVTNPFFVKGVTKRDDLLYKTVIPEAMKLGYWPTPLTSFDYTFFVMPSGLVSDNPVADPTKPNKKSTEGTNWSGFAQPDLKIAVFNNDYVKASYIQMHELGHLLFLAHSAQYGTGIIDQYGHNVGFMGGSTLQRFNDDEEKCFNGAKSWQLGWYWGSETCLRTNNSCFKSRLVGLVGLSDYVNIKKDLVEGFKANVVVRVIDKGYPVYLMYNKADGLNDDTGECINGISLTIQNDGRGIGQGYQSIEGPCLFKPGSVATTYGELNYYFEGKLAAPKKSKLADIVAICIYNVQWATENNVQAKDACCARVNGYECCTDADCDNKDATCNPTSHTCEGGTPTVCSDDDGGEDDGGAGGGGNNNGNNGGANNNGGGNTGSSTGDPHITTFDGFAYDCQARGDVVLARSLNSTFEIQGRYSAAGTRVSGVTLTTGVVVKEEGLPLVQVSFFNPASISQGCPADFFVDGVRTSFEDGSGNPDIVVSDQTNKIIISYPQTGLEVMLRKWISGSFGCSFSTSVFLPYSYRGDEQIVGILGSPNGDTQDDWMEVNGTIITRSPGGVRGEYAYNYCVRWCISNQSDSLFDYTNSNDSFDDIEDCLLPYNNQIGNAVANPPAGIVELCGGDEACILDGVAGDAQDAANYLQGEQEILQYREDRTGISLLPSMKPSAYASHEPSVSINPSSLPTLAPSNKPSRSSEPSQVPSMKPSNNPSSIPTISPTNEPTSSSLPTRLPSFKPSEMPSAMPSRTGKKGKNHVSRLRQVN